MPRSVILAIPALLMVSCDHYIAFRGEDWHYYYAGKATEEKEVKVGQRMIKTWYQNPIHKDLIGWLEEWQYRPAGDKKWRTIYYIYEKRGLERIGYITEEGIVYRYTRSWEPEKVGEWDMVRMGLKVFFNVPLNINLDLEEIDPYVD